MNTPQPSRPSPFRVKTSASAGDLATGSTLSAEPREEAVRIGYFNPDAAHVFVAGSFNHWEPRTLPMERDATGNWSVTLSLPPGEYHYRLIVDGEWRDHPGAAREVLCPFGGHNAVLVV